MPISGSVAAVYRQTTAAGTAFADAATTEVTGTGITAYTRYQVTNTAYRYWDKSQAVTVKVNGTIVTTGFTLEYLSGFVVFDTARASTDTVTVSGTAYAMEQDGGMFDWKLDLDSDMIDVTTFASNGWKEFIASLNGFSGSASAFWTNTDYADFLTNGEEVVLVLYTDDTANKDRYEGYAVLKQDTVDVQTKAVVKDTINFEGDGTLYYREG